MKRISILLAAAAILLPATSRAALVGEVSSVPLTLPYSQTFDEESSMADFTIYDENNDGIHWTWEPNGEAYCQQNPNKAMDDWMITRPVYLKAATDYYFSIDARRNRASETERFEVYLGTSPTPDDMTVELIQPTEPVDAYRHTYEKTIRVSESGTYYIGVHGISDKWKSRMCVDNISLKEGANDMAPAAPTALAVTPDPDGWLNVAISFITPKTDVNGTVIDGITGIHIFRDDVEIYSKPVSETGVRIEWTDVDVTAGTHTYAVAASNGKGVGALRSQTVYVGLYRPLYPSNVTLAETSSYGEVKLTWEAPLKDVEGNDLDPTRVTYRITEPIDGGENLIVDDITGLSYTFRALDAGVTQEFKDYYVYAKTNGGESYLPARSTTAAVGSPFVLPYRESFAIVNGSTITPLAISTIAGAGTWMLYDDEDYALGKIRSQDGDNGYTAMYARTLNHAASVFTAKLDLSGCEHPAVSFYTYKMAADDRNEISVQVSQQGNPFGTVSTVKVSEVPGEGWAKVTVPLTRYRNRVVQLGLLATTITDAYTPVDNFQVYDMAETDLSVGSFTVAATARVNEPVEVTVNVENVGYGDVAEATVELWVDGTLCKVSEPFAIASGEVRTVSFTLSFSVFEAGSRQIEAKIVCNGDSSIENNETGPATIDVVSNEYPVVNDLSALQLGSGVELCWTAPDENSYVAPAITDDFESYPRFANEDVGPWTLYDGDKGFIGGIGSGDNALDFPGISGQQSWWVMDAAYEALAEVGYVQFWEAHSGTKYLMQEYVTNEGGTAPVACDDWIISPELSGSEQTVSFWAKSYNKSYSETFEIMVSRGTDAIEDFEEFDREEKITDEWTEYMIAIPAGVKYFAIRCVSNNRMAMFVDDITYVPGGEAVAVHLVGFNVYRDGVRINESMVASVEAGTRCSFVDGNPMSALHSYAVTAVYDKGESMHSNEAIAELSGVEAVETDMDTDSPVYYNMQGVRVIAPKAGVPYIEVQRGKARKVVIK